MKAQNVLATIGNTPHIRLSRLFPQADVWVKSERTNPGGSIKDRIALAMVEAAEADGALQPGYAGIRPKIVPKGAPGQDFVLQGRTVHGVDGLFNLFGIESPGLTASVAIAADVAAMVNV